jgi:choline dehydrogenase-like flavoprotein
MKAFVSAVLFAFAFAAAAQAPNRTIPADAKRGWLKHVQERVVDVDGAQRQLTPGAQIRDESNRVVLPASLQAARDVRYLEDGEGRIRQVWILAPLEAQQAR